MTKNPDLVCPPTAHQNENRTNSSGPVCILVQVTLQHTAKSSFQDTPSLLVLDIIIGSFVVDLLSSVYVFTYKCPPRQERTPPKSSLYSIVPATKLPLYPPLRKGSEHFTEVYTLEDPGTKSLGKTFTQWRYTFFIVIFYKTAVVSDSKPINTGEMRL